MNSNSLTISSTSTVTTQFTVTRAPVNTHSFVSWSPGTSNSNVTDASLLVNPASAAADTNLLGLAVNSSPVFLVDADGDVFAKSVTLSGGSTLATTTIGGNVSIEGNTTLGDAPNNDTTLINGYTRLFATSTQPALTIWNSNSGNLLSLQTGSTQATNIFTVDHNGQTTIGTSTPAGLSTLTVAATTTTSIPLTLKGVSGQTANLFQALYSDNTSALTLTNTGLFGIGTSSPAFTLSVQGNALLGSTTVQGLTATGTIAVQGSGTSTFANGLVSGGILSTNGLTVQGGSILSSGLLTVTNTGTSTFSGGISTAGLSSSNGFTITTGNLNIPSGIFSVGGTGSSTITNGLTTGGLSSSNGLTITGGSFLSSVPFTNTASATSTFSGFLTVSGTNSTSTFSGGLTTATLNVTSSTASSTFSNGIRLTNGCFQDTTGTCVINPWTVGSGNISYSEGSVGVGTSTPAQLLSVQGNGYFSGTSFFGGAITATSSLTVSGQTTLGYASTTQIGSSDSAYFATSAGNVGIGTTRPASKLVVHLATDQNVTTTYGNSVGQIGNFNDGQNAYEPFYVDGSSLSLNRWSGGAVGIGAVPSGSATLEIQNTSTHMPDIRLHYPGVVEYNIGIDGSNTLHLGSQNSDLSVTDTRPFVLTSGGNVGIGTTNPGAKLEVDSGAGAALVLRKNSVFTGSQYMEFQNSSGAATVDVGFAGSDNTLYFSNQLGNQNTVIATNGGNILLSGGSIGMTMPGTQNLIAACHSTDGTNGVASSNFIVDCSGAPSDIAEWYDTSSDVGLGDIVVPSSTAGSQFNYSSGIGDVFDKDGHKTEGVPLPGATTTISVLSKSTTPYQVNTLGIVSTAPYQTFGEDVKNTAAHPQRIALAGRVPVKISTENGVIHAGDRITSSSLAGYGMKATHDGITVGIALQDFDPANSLYGIGQSASTTEINGNTVQTGKILVYVNLGYSKLDSSTSQVASDTTTNAWSVDQQSGKVNVSFFGNINMQGNDILDVGKIAGMFGKWKIDEDGTMTAVKVITNEVLTESLSVKSSLELGSMEKPAGMTIYDRTTGEPYCVGIDIGEWFKQKGKCNSTPLFSQLLNSGIGYSPSLETAGATTSPTSSETASTTPPMETLSSNTASTTATTTEP